MTLSSKKIAWLFPGQGSQSVGMLAAYLADDASREIASAAIAEADAALLADPEAVPGERQLSEVIAEGPADSLSLTTNTQPAMLLAGVVSARVWQAFGGPQPVVMAGHSLGEFTALVMAGVLDFAEAIRLVRLRAHAMQAAVPVGQGGMAAILGLDAAQVVAICHAQSKPDAVVEAVNFNALGQVVIAGHQAAVNAACEALKAAGAKRALPLPVSAPFHSSLMRPAAEKLGAALSKLSLQTPHTPVINNVDVASPAQPDAIRDALVRQAYSPVRWTDTIAKMASAEVTHFVECGPGKVLAGLVKRACEPAPTQPAYAVYDPATIRATIAALVAD